MEQLEEPPLFEVPLKKERARGFLKRLEGGGLGDIIQRTHWVTEGYAWILLIIPRGWRASFKVGNARVGLRLLQKHQTAPFSCFSWAFSRGFENYRKKIIKARRDLWGVIKWAGGNYHKFFTIVFKPKTLLALPLALRRVLLREKLDIFKNARGWRLTTFSDSNGSLPGFCLKRA
jgi:hypothetical protein